jgi:hypothetical protein
LGGSDALAANGWIDRICTDPAGNIYAAGSFTDGANLLAGRRYVAKYNGSTWSELGGTNSLDADSIIYVIYCDAVGNIYAGGSFSDSSGYNYVAQYGYSAYTTLTDTIYQGGAVSAGGHSYTASGTYTDTLAGYTGADSVVVLRLRVLPTSLSTESRYVCAGSTYTFGSHTLSTAGTYIDTFTTIHGCDSIVTLHLLLLPAASGTISQTICAGSTYTLGAHVLSAAGTYYDTLAAVNGCDSIVTLHLSLLPAAGSGISQSICTGGTYTFGGHTLSASGTYYDTLAAVNGCDSIVTLHLSLLPAAGSTTSQSICTGGTYTFGGHILSAGGTYYDTLSIMTGCDSIVTLQLSLLPAVGSTISESICAGSTYTFGGGILSAAGIYYDTLSAATGCDSIVTLDLSFLPGTVQAQFTLQASPIPHSWYLINQCTGTAPLTYTWSWGDGSPVSISDTPSHTYDSAGYYNICVTISDSPGCSSSYCDSAAHLFKDQSSQMVTVNVVYQAPSGIASVADGSFLLYPNPAMTFAYLSSPCSIETVRIFSQTGEIVEHVEYVNASNYTLSVGHLAKGIYYVQIITSDDTAVRKLILE